MNDINTFQCYEGELCLRGTDSNGEPLVIWFDSYDFLNWIGKSEIKYIKEETIKHIKKL